MGVHTNDGALQPTSIRGLIAKERGSLAQKTQKTQRTPKLPFDRRFGL